MNPVRRSVSGAVLAGGLSQRMGKDKALLRLNGMTLLERSIQTLQSAVTSVVVAAGQVDRYEIPGIRIIGDTLPACGPLGGVLAALEDSAADAVIILACDLPFVTTELIRLLVETEPSSSLVVPSVGADVQPLCACYAVSLKVPLRVYLEEGRRRVSDFASAQQHTRITITPDHPVYHPHLLSNVNTEAELMNAEALRVRGPHHPAP